jgi:hypothetical protein
MNEIDEMAMGISDLIPWETLWKGGVISIRVESDNSIVIHLMEDTFDELYSKDVWGNVRATESRIRIAVRPFDRVEVFTLKDDIDLVGRNNER